MAAVDGEWRVCHAPHLGEERERGAGPTAPTRGTREGGGRGAAAVGGGWRAAAAAAVMRRRGGAAEVGRDPGGAVSTGGWRWGRTGGQLVGIWAVRYEKGRSGSRRWASSCCSLVVVVWEKDHDDGGA
jgi:hypothetical protein